MVKKVTRNMSHSAQPGTARREGSTQRHRQAEYRRLDTGRGRKKARPVLPRRSKPKTAESEQRGKSLWVVGYRERNLKATGSDTETGLRSSALWKNGLWSSHVNQKKRGSAQKGLSSRARYTRKVWTGG